MKAVRWICALLALPLVCAAMAEAEEIQYFFLNPCESCSPEADFARDFKRLTGQTLPEGGVRYYNVFRDADRAVYDRLTAGLSEAERALPLLVLDGRLYAGKTAVSQGLQARFGVNPVDTRSVVYFLTATACESCVRAREVIDRHPAIMPVAVDGETVASEVVVEEINVNAQTELALALLKLYAVPDEARVTPMVLMGETCLSGEAAIAERFLPLLRSGAALGSPVPQEADTPSGDAITLGGAALAGVTAGFNPCALSMLLLFLGTLLSMKRNVALYGSLYLAGKLALYLAIGLGLSRLWARFAPSWLPTATRLIATAIGVGLIGLNLADAWNARRGEYGKIRNQLPSPLRGGLRKRILRGALSKWLGLSAVALGLVIGVGEFLCAGQLYLAVLIAGAESGGALPVLAYCLAFLMPSVAVLLAATLSRRTASASDAVLRWMPGIKLATAFVLAATLVIMWVRR